MYEGECTKTNLDRMYVSARWSITCICTTCKSNYIHTLIYTINIHVLITLHLLSVEKIQKKKKFNLSDRMSVKFLSLFAFKSKHKYFHNKCTGIYILQVYKLFYLKALFCCPTDWYIRKWRRPLELLLYSIDSSVHSNFDFRQQR